jgi:hypothetical protein
MKTFVTDGRGRACAEKSFFARKTARGASSRNESDKSFGRHEHRTPPYGYAETREAAMAAVRQELAAGSEWRPAGPCSPAWRVEPTTAAQQRWLKVRDCDPLASAGNNPI